jgi:hypothetical protein
LKLFWAEGQTKRITFGTLVEEIRVPGQELCRVGICGYMLLYDIKDSNREIPD